MLQQRHGWLEIDNGVISSAWMYLLLWHIPMISGACEQKRARKKKTEGGLGGGRRVFKRFRSHIYNRNTPAVRSKIWSKLTFASLCDTPIARITHTCM